MIARISHTAVTNDMIIMQNVYDVIKVMGQTSKAKHSTRSNGCVYKSLWLVFLDIK